MTTRSISGLSQVRFFSEAFSSADPLFPIPSVPFVAKCPPNHSPFPLRLLCYLCGESSSFSGLPSPIRQIPAKNAKSTNITLQLSIILINNCRRADILDHARKQTIAKPARLRRRPLQKLRTASVSVLLLATSHSPLVTKSNHSRTSETFARKSNHSRTYAKTGGGGEVHR
jgi:hypothetical protein